MRLFLKVLAVCYFIGGCLHLLDLLDLRLIFSEMNHIWKIWVICLLVFDYLAAIGLWKNKNWGEYLFLLIALSQLVAYSGAFKSTFGNQWFLVLFHMITLGLYFFFIRQRKLT